MLASATEACKAFWKATGIKDRGISRALERGNIASREARAIGRNGCFEPGFRRENERAPARTRPLAKPYPCVELGACVHQLARSGVYRAKPITGADDLALMRRIDELHLELPFYGSRRMIFEQRRMGTSATRIGEAR
jgi:hypothetical protein